ncbi:adenylate kinase family protein [Candidatus Cytomitobacter primus]|uniref:Adenylate kinase n=1 Tax=Candidatus Cytomitobacter primus TaxID=2066024 RepID=A0A5C0UGB5_9PROT|nr:nucleoside monophosphate kinase [Candidatus Cytomitobacter primus]QEK38721.1 adenylate kinase [Candidatus Cytomitobacter primus]
MLNLAFLGPPGSGKGTQALIVSAKLKLDLVSMGDMLREECESGSVLGNEINQLISKGNLVPIHIIKDMIHKKVKSADHGILFDGIPRNIDQAIFLDDALSDLKQKLSCVIEFQISSEDVINRLKKRYICSDCSAILSIDNNDLACNKCGSFNIEKRDDDISENAIQNRLQIFGEESKKILEFYAAKNILHKINADQNFNDVTNSILSLIC